MGVFKDDGKPAVRMGSDIEPWGSAGTGRVGRGGVWERHDAVRSIGHSFSGTGGTSSCSDSSMGVNPSPEHLGLASAS